MRCARPMSTSATHSRTQSATRSAALLASPGPLLPPQSRCCHAACTRSASAAKSASSLAAAGYIEVAAAAAAAAVARGPASGQLIWPVAYPQASSNCLLAFAPPGSQRNDTTARTCGGSGRGRKAVVPDDAVRASASSIIRAAGWRGVKQGRKDRETNMDCGVRRGRGWVEKVTYYLSCCR